MYLRRSLFVLKPLPTLHSHVALPVEPPSAGAGSADRLSPFGGYAGLDLLMFSFFSVASVCPLWAERH